MYCHHLGNDASHSCAFIIICVHANYSLTSTFLLWQLLSLLWMTKTLFNIRYLLVFVHLHAQAQPGFLFGRVCCLKRHQNILKWGERCQNDIQMGKGAQKWYPHLNFGGVGRLLRPSSGYAPVYTHTCCIHTTTYRQQVTYVMPAWLTLYLSEISSWN